MASVPSTTTTPTSSASSFASAAEVPARSNPVTIKLKDLAKTLFACVAVAAAAGIVFVVTKNPAIAGKVAAAVANFFAAAEAAVKVAVVSHPRAFGAFALGCFSAYVVGLAAYIFKTNKQHAAAREDISGSLRGIELVSKSICEKNLTLSLPIQKSMLEKQLNRQLTRDEIKLVKIISNSVCIGDPITLKRHLDRILGRELTPDELQVVNLVYSVFTESVISITKAKSAAAAAAAASTEAVNPTTNG